MSWYSSTTSSSTYYYQQPEKVVKRGPPLSISEAEEVRDELIKISKEQEEERIKNLPIFDPKDLDI